LALSDQIREVRKERGISQQRLAERAGLALSQVGKLEQGAITDPHIGTLRQIATALGIPVAELLEESSGKVLAPQ